MSWNLYLLECSDGSFYTGITNRLDERVAAHNSGQGAKYTRGRLPVKVLKTLDFPDRSSASKAEATVKKLRKNRKLDYFSQYAK